MGLHPGWLLRQSQRCCSLRAASGLLLPFLCVTRKVWTAQMDGHALKHRAQGNQGGVSWSACSTCSPCPGALPWHSVPQESWTSRFLRLVKAGSRKQKSISWNSKIKERTWVLLRPSKWLYLQLANTKPCSKSMCKVSFSNILLIKGILIAHTKILLVFMEEKKRIALGLGLTLAFCFWLTLGGESLSPPVLILSSWNCEGNSQEFLQGWFWERPAH